jgi:2-methylisocitrate lyase-like PEP mutase family enzyme
MATQAALATTFRSLHIPTKPIILTNIYDAPSATAIASLPQTVALATASYAVAASSGLPDDALTLSANLAAVRAIAAIAQKHNLPLTVDFQDGYGEALEEGVRQLLELGVVGINLEDHDRGRGMFGLEEAAGRVRRVLDVAGRYGVSDFVVNARADVLLHGGSIAEAVERGKAYLAAGATTVFVLGGSARGGIMRDEYKELATAFEGRLNVGLSLQPGSITVKELADIGVARISIGPQLQFAAMKALAEQAEKLLQSR